MSADLFVVKFPCEIGMLQDQTFSNLFFVAKVIAASASLGSEYL